ncbi:50S ribosomal protein L29 ['Fragaria x ananassa' phyllody phytoplasma]|uniref:Large ribosomal subunit protein uL29 n=1 Tax='Fragaria x ananassa' phyllody phytoplasma TaxID=2358428 RepID=A0ABS5K328_9MOLU|nr:50S ribosomal protein L29 ['Fragaria x ananassa' phyllody phytoplasma]
MKMQEILKMNSEELENKVVVLHQELFDLRFQLALGKLTNTAQIRKLKKSIARIKTILTQKKIISNSNLIQPSKSLKISSDNTVSTLNDSFSVKQEVNINKEDK